MSHTFPILSQTLSNKNYLFETVEKWNRCVNSCRGYRLHPPRRTFVIILFLDIFSTRWQFSSSIRNNEQFTREKIISSVSSLQKRKKFSRRKALPCERKRTKIKQIVKPKGRNLRSLEEKVFSRVRVPYAVKSNKVDATNWQGGLTRGLRPTLLYA